MGVQYDFAFRPYDRSFKRSLRTHHGEWRVRQGLFIFLRHQDTGQLGGGEIAPLPWFGTETMDAAIAFCSSLPRSLSQAQILEIPNQLPCAQFGFGTALESMQNLPGPDTAPSNPVDICGLLPAGKKALTAWTLPWQQGHRTFKWKIGVTVLDQELAVFRALTSVLPVTAKLRLDANGGLTQDQAHQWGIECDRVQSVDSAPTIEYLEQPLPPEQWRSLQSLACDVQTPIALDESVATLADLEHWRKREWPGYYVIKPAIMGFPWQIRQSCQRIQNAKVFSSVFESDVGRAAALALAQEVGTPGLALGFGVDHWLAESPKVSISSSIFS